MERISRFRAIMLLVLFAFVLVLFAGRLFVLQIIETNGNTDNTQTYTTITTVRAARGDILDRNGNVLVGNRASYNLVFNHYVIESNDETNQELYELVQLCKELGIEYNDHFPVTKSRPFVYTLTDFNTSWQNYFQLYMVDRELDSDITAPLLIEKLRERYKIPETWSEEDARAVIGFRYEFDLRGITSLPTYTFMEDVSDENLSAILELNTPGLMVESSTVREYHTKYGAHILGYLGGMDADEWAKYQQEGYSMDAYVGQSGFEEAFEEYLHGIDGQRVDVVSKDGTIISQYYRKDPKTGKSMDPVAGKNVETTIDITLQGIAEDALADRMKKIVDPEYNKEIGEHTGLDAQGAAVVVMSVKTGEILACASYPTYDLSTMHEDWDEIEANPLKPFFNRAFGAAYAPGSTFKMCTLITAMENVNSQGKTILEPGEAIADTGIYDHPDLPGFHPECLLWSSSTAVHSNEFSGQPLTGEYALAYSCNVFFYELGRRCTWQMVAETCTGLGLGVPTGIELVEETGRQNTEEVKRQVYGTGVNANFSAGDRVLGGIGQAEHRYTPLQLCIYACTLANQGTRYSATFLNRVVSSDYRELILDKEPEVASKMEISWQTYETYLTGMQKVINTSGGTAAKYFGGWGDQYGDEDGVWPLKGKVNVWAKTGTAEHASGGSDHGAFICFAAREGEEPEVAIAIYGEKVAHGSSLAPVAEDILEAYFEMDAASEVTAFENQVG